MGGRERGAELKRCRVGHRESFIFCVYLNHIFSIIALRRTGNYNICIHHCQCTSGTNLASIRAAINDCIC